MYGLYFFLYLKDHVKNTFHTFQLGVKTLRCNDLKLERERGFRRSTHVPHVPVLTRFSVFFGVRGAERMEHVPLES